MVRCVDPLKRAEELNSSHGVQSSVFSVGQLFASTSAALVLLVGAVSASRQGVLPAFEVVSIKLNVALNPVMVIRLPPGGVNGVNVTPQLLMRYAFELPDSRIVDLPDWAKKTRYDIVAKAPASAANEDMRPMIRALLRDRFKLITREEPRPTQVHVLTRESDRPSGPRLMPASGACAQPNSVNKSGALSIDEKCGLSIAFGRVRGGGLPLSQLASGLETLTGAVVIDRTGLSGTFDFALDYTPDAVGLDAAVAKDFPDIDPAGPSLATALREQLGLRWLTQTEPVNVLAVVEIQPPEPD
jgi:uncharacterized protein (TIGR03435 family)